MQANRRGLKIAVAGLVLQTALVVLAVRVWYVTRALPALPAVWLVVAPLLLWLLTALLFYCRFLERREDKELQELAARGGDAEGLFAGEQQIRPAASRLRWMERYLVGACTLLLAGYHAALGILTLRWVGSAEATVAGSWTVVVFTILGWFAAFLFSRYATGMARVKVWSLLRAAGSYLFVDCLVLITLAVSLGLEAYEIAVVGRVAAYALSALLIVLGAELTLNFILDLYRPRIPGADRRASFDSRLLNLIASPERVGHSIAEALNYQFGFEVSRTWFYQLLRRALLPLLLAGAAVIWLLTSVVIVEEGQRYVVLRWGKKEPRRVLTPRRWPYLIWPWPMDKATPFDVGKVHTFWLGLGGDRKEEIINGKRIYLWSKEHGPRRELDVLVAKPADVQQTGKQDIPAVNIIKLVVAVDYRIREGRLYRFGYAFDDAVKLAEAVAYREMICYAASATLDEPLPDDADKGRPQGLMSFGRQEAQRDLFRNISGALGKLDLGIEIVRVQLLGCHPPTDAAPAFEEVIAAEREQDKLRYAAEAEANELLSTAAGDPRVALELAQRIGFTQDLEKLVNARAGKGRMAGALEKVIERSTNEIEKLNEEIELERLLGRLTAGRKSVAEELLDRQRKHLEQLRAVGQAPAADLDSRLAAIRRAVGKDFEKVGGGAAVQIAQARADRWKTEFEERARAQDFPVQLAAFQAAPAVYRVDKYLQALAGSLVNQQKYILGVDPALMEIWLNLEQSPQPFEEVPYGKSR